jgi:hypothetical protein
MNPDEDDEIAQTEKLPIYLKGKEIFTKFICRKFTVQNKEGWQSAKKLH